MELNGKKVTEYLIDLSEFRGQPAPGPNEVLFCYAEYETGKALSDSQLVKLSKKYPEVIKQLIEG